MKSEDKMKNNNIKVNLYFLGALILAFLSSIPLNAIFGDSIIKSIIVSGLTLGTIITWIGYTIKTDKLKKIDEKEKELSTASFVWELTKTIVGVLLFVIIFRFFVLQPYLVIGESMHPDFQNGDYLFVDELTYHFRGPARGEVIVFRHPEDQCTNYINNNPLLKDFFQGPCKNYIKRVIGLPNETVTVKNGEVSIKNSEHPNGFFLNETYIAGVKTLGNLTVTLGKDEYFVLGDNRQPNASSDSREWGPLTPKYIVGKAWLRLLPPESSGFIPTGKYDI